VRTEPEMGSPEFWAHKTPDAVAVIKGDRQLTYAQWDEMSNKVAERLFDLGLRPGDRLGMRFRIDLPWVVVQRALQKLDVAQVAVNWKLTPDEVLHILNDSGAKGLACDDVDASLLGDLDCGLLITVGQKKGTDGHRLEELLETEKFTPRFGPLRPSMVLYTSGTTGAPKGVPPVDLASVDFDRLLRYGAAVGEVPPVPSEGVVLMTLPVHHGAGPASATAACARGGTAILLDPYDPEEALQLIEKHKVQVWTSVPTMLLRIQSLPEEVVARHDLSSIHALNVGAAAVPFSLKTWIIDKIGPVLWEAYGCSEAGMISFMAPEDQLRKPGSSGKAYEGVEIEIANEDWSRLGTNETGEIIVNTPVVLKNYLGREALGEETVMDGFYRTGDVGHLDEDGYLFITDRIKDMIVAGGVNIYPAEIERAMVEHPDIEDCAVIGIPHEEFGEKPLAFLVPRKGAEIDVEDISAFLDGRLASFKKPREYEIVSSLPMSPMGKVLKNELRKPYWEGRERNV
jgi:long-chain acyl-CoA synthetase